MYTTIYTKSQTHNAAPHSRHGATHKNTHTKCCTLMSSSSSFQNTSFVLSVYSFSQQRQRHRHDYDLSLPATEFACCVCQHCSICVAPTYLRLFACTYIYIIYLPFELAFVRVWWYFMLVIFLFHTANSVAAACM